MSLTPGKDVWPLTNWSGNPCPFTSPMSAPRRDCFCHLCDPQVESEPRRDVATSGPHVWTCAASGWKKHTRKNYLSVKKMSILSKKCLSPGPFFGREKHKWCWRKIDMFAFHWGQVTSSTDPDLQKYGRDIRHVFTTFPLWWLGFVPAKLSLNACQL